MWSPPPHGLPHAAHPRFLPAEGTPQSRNLLPPPVPHHQRWYATTSSRRPSPPPPLPSSSSSATCGRRHPQHADAKAVDATPHHADPRHAGRICLGRASSPPPQQSRQRRQATTRVLPTRSRAAADTPRRREGAPRVPLRGATPPGGPRVQPTRSRDTCSPPRPSLLGRTTTLPLHHCPARLARPPRAYRDEARQPRTCRQPVLERSRTQVGRCPVMPPWPPMQQWWCCGKRFKAGQGS